MKRWGETRVAEKTKNGAVILSDPKIVEPHSPFFWYSLRFEAKMSWSMADEHQWGAPTKIKNVTYQEQEVEQDVKG